MGRAAPLPPPPARRSRRSLAGGNGRRDQQAEVAAILATKMLNFAPGISEPVDVAAPEGAVRDILAGPGAKVGKVAGAPGADRNCRIARP